MSRSSCSWDRYHDNCSSLYGSGYHSAVVCVHRCIRLQLTAVYYSTICLPLKHKKNTCKDPSRWTRRPDCLNPCGPTPCGQAWQTDRRWAILSKPARHTWQAWLTWCWIISLHTLSANCLEVLNNHIQSLLALYLSLIPTAKQRSLLYLSETFQPEDTSKWSLTKLLVIYKPWQVYCHTVYAVRYGYQATNARSLGIAAAVKYVDATSCSSKYHYWKGIVTKTLAENPYRDFWAASNHLTTHCFWPFCSLKRKSCWTFTSMLLMQGSQSLIGSHSSPFVLSVASQM